MRSILFFISLLICLSPITVYGLQITSLANAEISSPFVYLKDIVIFSDESETSNALGSMRICTAPPIGKDITIQTTSIQKKLSRSFDLTMDILWTGAPTTTIARRGIRINPTDVTNSIYNFLQENQDKSTENTYSFSARLLPLPFDIPTGQLVVNVIPSNPNIIGSNRFSLIYLVDGKTVKNISIKGDLKVMGPVAVLVRNVKKGTILQPEMIGTEIKDLSKLRNPIVDLKEVIGKKLIKRLRNGSILEYSFIDFPPIIHKGQLVKMIVKHKGLQLTATGISYMNGKQNQIIKVKNIRSNKNIFCKVSSPGIVEVQI